MSRTICGASSSSARTSCRRRGPSPIPAALEQDEIELVVQVNGKLRGSIVVPKQADKATIESLARSNANVQRFVAGQNGEEGRRGSRDDW